jgi:hypothetical protein
MRSDNMTESEKFKRILERAGHSNYKKEIYLWLNDYV